ncbi:hypothetical protein RUM43_009482 [Polyplax serrata]|uniref:F-box domain-containing protein n=1 Tax=Polyplax serrata TaxID=468196 RepID=A0AAN8S4J7_POLSC
MFTDSSSDISKTSVYSSRSRRSGKSLSERIRELGVTLKSEQLSDQSQTLQIMVMKIERNEPSNLAIMTPNLNLEQIIYYQPELLPDQSTAYKRIYKIEQFETKSGGPKELQRISDIEEKESVPPREPSEESIWADEEEHKEPPKEIHDLPESTLLEIFSYLNQKDRLLHVPRVCKSWYFLSKDPTFWKELEFKGDKVPAPMIIQLLQQHPSIERLRLISVSDVVEILQELCRCNNEIKELRLRNCNVGNIDFSRIILHVVSCCTNLEILDIKGMRFTSERFYLELGRLKKLKSINLSGNKLVRSQDLITLAVNCRTLQDLRILDTNLDSTQGAVLKDDDLIFMLSHLQRNLHTLKMDMHQLGNISYQAILKCSKLQCLALKNCLLLSSEVFRQFPALRHLKKLKLTRAINIKADDFQFLFISKNMRFIEELDLNGCWNIGEVGLKAIAGRLAPCLRQLSIKNCKSIKQNELSILSPCTKLTYLNVAHTNVDPVNLAQLPGYISRNLRELVLTWDMSKKTLRHLQKSLPAVTIKLSFSEYQKDERIFEDF